MPCQPEFPLANDKPLATNETPHTIALGNRVVAYVLRRAKRRTIGLTIDHRGLRVGAPPRASVREVESLILRHGDWITNKLDEWRTRRRPEALQIVDGIRLPLLGQSLEVRLAVGANRAIWTPQTPPILTLCLRVPGDATRVLEKSLHQKARLFFAERLALFATQMELSVPPLSLSSARTRWGSCSSKTGIHLNWRLIHFPAHVVDYVVVHELAHLREMNHSRRFWAIVGQHCPEHRELRDELKRLAATIPHW